MFKKKEDQADAGVYSPAQISLLETELHRLQEQITLERGESEVKVANLERRASLAEGLLSTERRVTEAVRGQFVEKITALEVQVQERDAELALLRALSNGPAKPPRDVMVG